MRLCSRNVQFDISYAACKSKFAKVACQLIVEQMHLILAAAQPGCDGQLLAPFLLLP